MRAPIVALTAVFALATCAFAQAPPPPPPPAAPAPAMPLAPPPPPDFQGNTGATIERFKQAYARRGAPRIAVFWNRQLSDRLSQWVTTNRVVTTDMREGGRNDGKDAGSTERVVSTQKLERDPARTSPADSATWEFQSGFLDPLLGAGARVVDRAAIMRLTAAKRTGVGSTAAPDEQKVEIQALQGFADVLVEILVAPSGQELNVTAKEVNTGLILAIVNSRSLPGAAPTREYVATSRGFESQDRPPAVYTVASTLSVGVMDALVRAWAR